MMIRILSKHVFKRGFEGEGVESHFALVDHALFVLKNKLDGVLNDDMALSWVFTYSSMQASVVDLPLPVAPDTKMMPRSLIAIFLSVRGGAGRRNRGPCLLRGASPVDLARCV